MDGTSGALVLEVSTEKRPCRREGFSTGMPLETCFGLLSSVEEYFEVRDQPCVMS
jgi:hypothetical protein